MKNKKQLIVGVMLLTGLFLSIAFATFSTTLNITGKGNITSDWDVAITNIVVTKSNSKISASYNITDNVSASLNTSFEKPGDKAEYTITVSNRGTIDAIINKVNIDMDETTYIKYSIEGLQTETSLPGNSDVSFKFIVEYDSSLTSVPDIEKEVIDIVIDCVQDENSELTPGDPIAEYEITYVAKGASNIPEKQYKNTGEVITLSSEIPTKTNYTFIGWSTVEGSDLVVYNPEDTYSSDSSLKLYAVWKIINVEVCFDANGGSVSTECTTYAANESYGTLPTPTKDKYKFIGWSKDKNKKEIIDEESIVPEEKHTLYATWELVDIEVCFDVNGGTGSFDCLILQKNEVYGTLPNPTREDYKFIGWSTTKTDADVISEDTIVTAKADHTLYAQWALSVVEVYFDANGGIVSPEYIDVTIGEAYGTLPTPERYGYIFNGWNTSDDGTGEMITDTTVVPTTTTGDYILYAQWTRQEVKVNLVSTIDTCAASPSSITIKPGLTYSNLPVLTCNGYSFMGWYTEEVGGVLVTTDTIVENTVEHTLYAVWQQSDYTVTFNPNGGSVSPSSKEVTYDSAYGSLPTPEKPGYVFNGWYTKETDGTQVTNLTIVTTAGNHTLYAYWSIATYAVTFDPLGGAVDTTSKTVTYLGTYGDLPTPEKTGYTFNGWNTKEDGTGTNIISSSSVSITNDHTLYASWTPINVTVNYKSNLIYGLYDIDVTKSWYMNYSVSDKVVTVTALQDDGYGFINARVYLEAGKTYTFSVDTSGTSTEVYLMFEGGFYYYILMLNYGNHSFVPEQTGEYWIRLDVNVSGETRTFSNLMITEALDSASISYGSNYTLPTVTKPNHTFDGWYTKEDGGTQVTTSTIMDKLEEHTLYAHWTPNTYTVTYNSNNLVYGLDDIGTTAMTSPHGSPTYSISNGDVTVTSTITNGYGFATAKVYLEKGKTYIFDCKTTGTWGHGNQMNMYLMHEGNYSYYIMMQSADNFSFVPERTGEYWLRFDVYVAGETHTFYDISFTTLETSTVTYGESYDSLPSISRVGYTFDGWYNTLDLDSLVLSAIGSDYNHQGIMISPIQPGTTYLVNIGSATLTSGSATNFMARLYDYTANTALDTALVSFGSNVSFELTAPEDMDTSHNIQIILYAGVWGSTSWNSVTYTNIKISTTGSISLTKYDSSSIVAIPRNHTLYAHWTPNNYDITYRSNLIENSNFTDGTNGWAGAEYAIISSETVAGLQALRVTTSNGGYSGLITAYSPTYKHNTTYRISFKAYRDSSSSYGDLTRTFRVYMPELDSTGNRMNFHHYFNITTSNLPNKTWTEFSYEFTTGSSGASFQYLRADFDAVAATANIWITDVKVEEIIRDTDREFGTVLGTLPTPTRNNYSFIGWYTGENGSGTKISSTNTVPHYDVDYYASWATNICTVTFNANGGSVSTTTKQVQCGTAIGDLPTPSMTGYTFTGWTSGGTTYSSSTIINSDVTLTANYSINSYTITYNANGGSVSPTSQTVTYGTAVTLPTPVYEGYTFNGWYTASSGGGLVGAAGSGYVVTTNITVYAQWTYYNHTCSYTTRTRNTYSSTVSHIMQYFSSSANTSTTDYKWCSSSSSTSTNCIPSNHINQGSNALVPMYHYTCKICGKVGSGYYCPVHDSGSTTSGGGGSYRPICDAGTKTYSSDATSCLGASWGWTLVSK